MHEFVLRERTFAWLSSPFTLWRGIQILLSPASIFLGKVELSMCVCHCVFVCCAQTHCACAAMLLRAQFLCGTQHECFLNMSAIVCVWPGFLKKRSWSQARCNMFLTAVDRYKTSNYHAMQLEVHEHRANKISDTMADKLNGVQLCLKLLVSRSS